MISNLTFAWLLSISPMQQEQISAVFVSAFLAQHRETPEELIAYFNKKITPRITRGDLIYSAFHESKMVGFVIFEYLMNHTYYLAEMGVLPDYQGIGIGKRLVFSIFKRDPDAEKIVLITETANIWAQAFYEKMGLQKSSFRPPNYSTGFIAYELNRKEKDCLTQTERL